MAGPAFTGEGVPTSEEDANLLFGIVFAKKMDGGGYEEKIGNKVSQPNQ